MIDKKRIFSTLLMATLIATVEAQEKPKAQPEIQVASVAEHTFTNQVPWTGIVQSQSAVTLTATLSGQIERLEAQDETAVKKGAMLFLLGGPRIEAKRTRLSSEIDGLQAQLQLASNTVERIQKNLDEHLATKDKLAAAKQSAIILQSRLQEARAALDSFEKQTQIVAPMDGVFTARRVAEGQQVNAGDPVAEVVNTNHLRIAASLFPPDGVDLLNQPATMRVTDKNTFEGKVAHVLPQRSSTGAVMIWIEGTEIDRNLQPGRNACGQLILGIKTASAVPEPAVVYDDREQTFVFVPNGTTYERRYVHTGRTADGWIEIRSGLKPGEKIVIQGAYELFYRDFTEQYKVQD